MAYIDKTYFASYTSTSIPDAELVVLAERASDIIDTITMDRINSIGFTNLLEATQIKIKKATAAQVEMLYIQGGIEALTGNSDADINNVSIGKFSYSKSNSGSKKLKTVNGIPLSPLVESYLMMTGLLYRGLGYIAETDT
jgi:hypothetical protein